MALELEYQHLALPHRLAVEVFVYRYAGDQARTCAIEPSIA